MPRSLKVDVSELVLAFDNPSEEYSYFLDLESGAVLLLTGDASSALQDVIEKFPGDVTDANLAEVLAASDMEDWMREQARIAFRVDYSGEDSIISVPKDEPSDGYRDMELFVEQVTDAGVYDRLSRALEGNSPLRRFKDALDSYPALEDRWYEFREERLTARVLEWLAGEEIELIEGDD